MNVEITPGDAEQIEVVQNLARFYIYDMSEFMGWRCSKTGLFGGCDELFDDWRAGTNHPFVVRGDGELAGFAGVKAVDVDGKPGHCIQEFFVLRKFRRRGLGKKVAVELFERFPGRWLVQHLAQNSDAKGFWGAVVAAYAAGKLTASDEMHPDWGKMTSIRFANG